MPTAFSARPALAAALLLLAGCKVRQAATLPISPGDLACSLAPGYAACILHQAGQTARPFNLTTDDTVLSGALPTLTVLGQVPGAVVLTATFPSQPGGMGLCQAGTERFLSVVALPPSPVAETYRAKLESCLDNVEPAQDGVAFDAPSRTLRLHWLSAPNTGQDQATALHIAANGTVTP